MPGEWRSNHGGHFYSHHMQMQLDQEGRRTFEGPIFGAWIIVDIDPHEPSNESELRIQSINGYTIIKSVICDLQLFDPVHDHLKLAPTSVCC